MNETQKSISDWAAETFGPATNLRVAIRANREMEEILTKLAVDENDPTVPEEIADWVITMARVVEKFGADLQEEVRRKMVINRARVWKLDGSGCGQSIK